MRSPWLLLLLLAGCRAAPLSPAPEALSYSPPNEVPPQLKIAAFEGSFNDTALVLKATVYHPGDWVAQAFLDTDADINTGRQVAGHGLERIARVVEADAGGVFPIRAAEGAGGPGSGGWGPVVGYGHFVRDDVTIHVVLPYDALADNDGVALRFTIYLSDGSFDFVDAVVEPSKLIARRMTKPMR